MIGAGNVEFYVILPVLVSEQKKKNMQKIPQSVHRHHVKYI